MWILQSELEWIEEGVGEGKALSPFHPQFCSIHSFSSVLVAVQRVFPPPRSGLHPTLPIVRFNLPLPLGQQLVIQLTSKTALSCSTNDQSFSFGSQPARPLSGCLFTIHLKSTLTSQSVVKWNNHWFLTRCINLDTIMERKENRGLRNNQSNNFWISVWK